MSRGAPLPPYIKEQGGGAAGHDEARQGGVLLLPGVGLPPFPCPSRRGGRKGERRGRKGGAPPLPPCPIRTRPWGGARPALGSPSLFPAGPNKAQYFSPANSRNSLLLRKIPESLGTFPNSEYSRPKYRSLRLDHFETPRHVPDLIRDSELLRYIKTYKLIMKLSSKP